MTVLANGRHNVLMINTISITDLKQNAAKAIDQINSVNGATVILQHSKPVAVLISPEEYRILEKALEDLEDIKALKDRADEETVSMDQIVKKLSD